MRLTINLDDEEVKILEKRAKKNILTLPEQVEDIIRRSCINSKKTTSRPAKIDDPLVAIFSRQKTGRKKGTKTKSQALPEDNPEYTSEIANIDSQEEQAQ